MIPTKQDNLLTDQRECLAQTKLISTHHWLWLNFSCRRAKNGAPAIVDISLEDNWGISELISRFYCVPEPEKPAAGCQTLHSIWAAVHWTHQLPSTAAFTGVVEGQS